MSACQYIPFLVFRWRTVTAIAFSPWRGNAALVQNIVAHFRAEISRGAIVCETSGSDLRRSVPLPLIPDVDTTLDTPHRPDTSLGPA